MCILGPASSTFRANDAPSHLKEISINKQNPNSMLTKHSKSLYMILIRIAAASSFCLTMPSDLCWVFQSPVLGTYAGKEQGREGPHPCPMSPPHVLQF